MLLNLKEQLNQQYLMWKQRAKEQWLADGDRNTSFFHRSTKLRRQKNYISTIKIDRENWIRNREEIAEYFISNFQNVYRLKSSDIPPD